MAPSVIREQRHRIDRRLLIRMGIFLAIGIVILGFILYDIVSGTIAWWLALAIICIGFLLGYPIGRAGRLRWHDTEDKVVSQMDVIGIVAILIYIAARFGSEWFLGRFLSGAALSAATLALLGGALVGRYLGTRRSIRNVLDQKS